MKPFSQIIFNNVHLFCFFSKAAFIYLFLFFRAFTQSGQLKTHQRLHAGEKPFVCSEAGCNNRYTHANRQCPDHPYAKPQRTSQIILQPNISASEDRSRVMSWLEKYKREKEDKTPGKFQEPQQQQPPREQAVLPVEAVKRSRSKRGLTEEMDQCVDQENSQPHQRSTAAAHQTLNQALQRAGERLQDHHDHHHRLLASPRRVKSEDYTTMFPVLAPPCRFTAASPVKKPSLLEQQHSPLKGIRRTLGDITPTKNCRSDQLHADQLDLPFNFGLPTSPALSASEVILRTPIPAEKYLSSPAAGGSPALKLKKRFQERFQEEKLSEREELAKPILWQDEDEFPFKHSYSPLKHFPSSSSLCRPP